MGGGASVLSSEDFVTMSQNLKEEYELLISAGHTDDEIRVKLMEKYNQLFISSDAVSAEADIVTASAVLTDGSLPITVAGIISINPLSWVDNSKSRFIVNCFCMDIRTSHSLAPNNGTLILERNWDYSWGNRRKNSCNWRESRSCTHCPRDSGCNSCRFDWESKESAEKKRNFREW